VLDDDGQLAQPRFRCAKKAQFVVCLCQFGTQPAELSAQALVTRGGIGRLGKGEERLSRQDGHGSARGAGTARRCTSGQCEEHSAVQTSARLAS
jgi:hypothetical protein